MGSTKESLAKSEHCPMVGRIVHLSGIRVSLAGQSAIAQKSCSNVASCLAEYKNLDRVSKCMLHTFGENG